MMCYKKKHYNQIICVFFTAMLVLSGCDSRTGKITAFSKPIPNEFKVTTQQPLTLPPDYSLTPLADTGTTPTIDEQDVNLRQTIFGQGNNSMQSLQQQALKQKGYSDSDIALLQQINTNSTTDNIRRLLKEDEASFSTISPSLTDKILFWREPKTNPNESVIDVSNEQKRVQNTIAKGQSLLNNIDDDNQPE